MFMDLRIGAKMKASRYTQGEKFPSRVVPPSLDTYFLDLVRFYVNVFFPLYQSVDFLKEWLFKIRKMCQYFFGLIIYTYLAWPFTIHIYGITIPSIYARYWYLLKKIRYLGILITTEPDPLSQILRRNSSEKSFG